MRKKGDSLGADAQLSKNEMGEFIQKLDEIITEKLLMNNLYINYCRNSSIFQ